MSKLVGPQQRLISPDRNSSGRARFMLVFSQLFPHWAAPVQRLVFMIGRIRPRSMNQIRQLSFIHFARFAVIRRLPGYGPRAPMLRHPLQLFESNYNGSVDAYIDSFVGAAPMLMHEFWASSYGFPWGRGRSLRSPFALPLGPFKRYIHLNEFEVDHYYSAYPEATATMIGSALEVKLEHDKFHKQAARSTPADFPSDYRSFVADVQAGSMMPADSTSARPRAGAGFRDPNRCGRAYAVTVITPIVGGRTDDLRRLLQKFGTLLQGFGSPSPLAKLGAVHFARWVIIDGLYTDFPDAPADPAELPCDYLLFSADVTLDGRRDRLPAAFFRQLAAHAEVKSVWKHCQGYPSAGSDAAFVKYLAAHQVQTSLYYAAFPDATVEEIKAALRVQREVVEFIRAHQEDDAAALQNLKTTYLQQSKRWTSSS